LKKSTKNILLVHSSNDLYGASKVLLNIIQFFISEGYEIHLFLPNNGPLNKNQLIKKCKLNVLEFGVFRKKYFNFFGLINRLYFITKSIYLIRKYILKNRIHLVYTNTSTIISPAIAAKLINIPTIYHLHEIPNSSKTYTKFLVNFIKIFSIKVIAVSKSVKNYWTSNGLTNEKITVIYNGFEFNFKKEKKSKIETINFINISRIIPYKGHLFLIELFNQISKYRKDLILNIIGDTLPEYESYYTNLKEKVKEYNLHENIHFLGFKEDVKKYLFKSDFFIHCPISPDPLPSVIFEAIESNLPVIYTNQGGAYEILDSGNNGLLINSLSISKSCDLILKYIDDKDLQQNHLNNSKSFILKNFQLSSFNNNLKKVIKDLVNKT
jgi:glycosyltransferase involved in cell wall biosynthesis